MNEFLLVWQKVIETIMSSRSFLSFVEIHVKLIWNRMAMTYETKITLNNCRISYFTLINLLCTLTGITIKVYEY